MSGDRPKPSRRVHRQPDGGPPGDAYLRKLSTDPGAFAAAIRDALAHLHDVAALAVHPLAILAGRARIASARRPNRTPALSPDDTFTPEFLASTLADQLRAAIQSLEPAVRRVAGAPDPDRGRPGRPPIDRAHRRAAVIRLHFLDGMPRQEILADLSVSRTEFYRLQAEGMQAIANLLRRSWKTSVRSTGNLAPIPPRPPWEVGADVPEHGADRFIGRETELRNLATILARSRLVTIIGAPGAGKTRLALEVARHLASSFKDGTQVVPLAGLEDATLVMPAIGRAFGVFDVQAADLEAHVVAALRDRRVLLVLDNFEHVLEAASDVGRLVRAAPGIVTIATSRAPLQVVGEQRFTLDPLPVPSPDARDDDLTPLQANPAVELFIDRARAIDPAFPHDQVDLEAAVEICRLVDGLPLAIELASARLGTLSASAILGNLRAAGPLATLGTGPRDCPARHRTLRDAIDWSRGLLGDGEARTLANLSTFVGGAAMPAILAAAAATESADGDGMIPAATTLGTHLEALVTHNLVRRRTLRDGTTRYGLLEAVRSYGLDMLREGGHLAEARRRHAAYFEAMTGRLTPQIRGGVSGHVIHDVDLDMPNIRAALSHFLESGEPLRALGMIVDLEFFWWLQGYRLEGFSALVRTITAAGESLRGDLRARALVMAGHLCVLNGEDVRARDYLIEGLAVAEATGATAAECDALHHLGVIARARGDDIAAKAKWEACIHRATPAAYPYRVGVAAWHLAMLAIDGARPDTAAEWIAAGRETFERHDLPVGRALVQYTEGEVAMATGAFTDARLLIEGAIHDLDAFGSATGVMYASGVLAELEYREGRLDAARDAATRGIDLMNGLGQPRGIARILITLGHVATEINDRNRARRSYLDALRRSIPPARVPNIAATLIGLAGLVVAEADLGASDHRDARAEAARLLGAATVLLRSINRPMTHVEAQHAARWLADVPLPDPMPTVPGALAIARALAATVRPGTSSMPVAG